MMKFNIMLDDIRLALAIAGYLRRIGHPEEAEEFEERCLLAVKDEIRKNKLDACENCKYFSGDGEFGRCTKHDHVMWSCADACKQFEFKEGSE